MSSIGLVESNALGADGLARHVRSCVFRPYNAYLYVSVYAHVLSRMSSTWYAR